MSRPYTEVRYATDEEWREARKNGVGGSDVAAIMGISKWQSPLEVWLVKTGREEPADLSDNEKVEWGTRLEPLIAQKFSEMHPEFKVKRKNCTMVSKERPWAFANIDREIVDSDGRHGVLEIKTAGARSDDDWADGVPAYYLTQIQHYLSVTGWDFAWCAVLIGGQKYKEILVPRDESDIESIDKAVDTFWNDYVQAGVLPQITGNGNESGALTKIYADPHDGYVPAMDVDLPELTELVELKTDIKVANDRVKEIECGLKARIGDSKGIETESIRCTWVRSNQKRFDQKRFKEEKPDLYEEYSPERVRDGGLRLSYAKD